ncbi:MAG: O-antigen ligase family protein, partial [Acidobacteriota bacterium]|nr:O-antigen ligase family protein [Acidobacteriota bacterium]
LKNPNPKSETSETAKERHFVVSESVTAEETVPSIENFNQISDDHAEQPKPGKKQRKIEKDERLLSSDRWLARNGHTLTYAGVFLFTLILYFRPYEWIPGLSSFNSMAFVVAVAMLLVYLPTQFSVEGSLTALPIEIKCVLFLGFWALLTVPIAREPALAWGKFSEEYIKVIIIFVVMINTLRTKSRLKGIMWLGVAAGLLLSYEAVTLYRAGIFQTEGYRVGVQSVSGMFGNSNDLALHLVIFMPIAVALGIASKNIISKLAYFISAGFMVMGNLVTQSRGGFLGLLGVAIILVWKFGKKQRFKTGLISSIVGLMVMVFAPGNFGLRMLSIFIPALDPVGSSDQRRELLIQSLWATLYNPQGLGIGNFRVISIRNLETHNAYTQISSELGWLAIIAYMILLISPLRKLGAIERRMFAREDFSWIYYLAIGVQASIIGYMVSSFFGPVAYQWYVYYPIAFAICLRRVYQTGQAEKGSPSAAESGSSDYSQLQTV